LKVRKKRSATPLVSFGTSELLLGVNEPPPSSRK
jgi:hypothetical protein